jgi:protein ImuB
MSLIRNLHASVRKSGDTARVAVSRNANAAAALAKALTSRTALKIIAEGEEAAALASLPLSVVELTEEQRETFRLWGFVHWVTHDLALGRWQIAALYD